MSQKIITATIPATIPLEEAAKQTSAYRQTMSPKGVDVKAFYISLEDLLGALQVESITVPDDYDISGIRVYMAINDLPDAVVRKHMYVVATQNPNLDIVEEDGESRIYDMTWPCPNLCSAENVLTGPQKNS